MSNVIVWQGMGGWFAEPENNSGVTGPWRSYEAAEAAGNGDFVEAQRLDGNERMALRMAREQQ